MNTPTETLIAALRILAAEIQSGDGVANAAIAEAADMLEFFFGQMQMHSPKMDGQHSYNFRGSGWPMTHCKGANAEDAVKSAIREIQRSRSENR